MHDLEERVVAVAENPGVKFHDRATPHVMDAVLDLELEDLIQDVLKELPELLRALSRFARIFREVIEHAPQVDQCTPINITEVHQQQVFFEIVNEAVVAREKEIPKVWAMRIAPNASLLLLVFLEIEELPREQVPTVNVFAAVRATALTCATVFSRTWADREDAARGSRAFGHFR